MRYAFLLDCQLVNHQAAWLILCIPILQLDYMTPVSCFFNEFVGTAMLMLVILAITDKKNGPPPTGLVPLVIFIAILGIGSALGMQTGYALNPARDLGPRILTAMVGYGRDVFNFRR